MNKTDLLNKLSTQLDYSVRRYYVDEFYSRNINLFSDNAVILDMGGKKINKRGFFDIEESGLLIKYANISKDTSPDYLCDISSIPIEDNSFDGIILSEVLEHVPDPKSVLKEAQRILKPGGLALICTPFMFHVHSDPYDYARYTDQYYTKVLSEAGFKDIIIEKQGLFFSVLASMMKLWANELSKDGRPRSGIKTMLFHKFVFWFQQKAFQWEKDKYYQENWMFSGYTTGYGIIGTKHG